MEKLALLYKSYAWPCVDSCSDYKYTKKFKQNLILRQLCTVVNYLPVICMRDFQKIYSLA